VVRGLVADLDVPREGGREGGRETGKVGEGVEMGGDKKRRTGGKKGVRERREGREGGKEGGKAGRNPHLVFGSVELHQVVCGPLDTVEEIAHLHASLIAFFECQPPPGQEGGSAGGGEDELGRGGGREGGRVGGRECVGARDKRGREEWRIGGREGGSLYLDVIPCIVIATSEVQAYVFAVVKTTVRAPGDPLVAAREGGWEGGRLRGHEWIGSVKGGKDRKKESREGWREGGNEGWEGREAGREGGGGGVYVRGQSPTPLSLIEEHRQLQGLGQIKPLALHRFMHRHTRRFHVKRARGRAGRREGGGVVGKVALKDGQGRARARALPGLPLEA